MRKVSKVVVKSQKMIFGLVVQQNKDVKSRSSYDLAEPDIESMTKIREIEVLGYTLTKHCVLFSNVQTWFKS